MTAEKRKPRDKPAPYQRQPKKPKVKDAPVTSACSTASHSSRQNLTLSDWLTVFAYVDAHQAMPQCDIVNHFKSLQSGALIFTQSTLSRKLKERLTLEARIERAGLKIPIPMRRPHLAQLTAVENEVAAYLQDLKSRNRIFGEPPSLDDFIEPAEEQEVGDSLEFEVGDKDIVAAVKRELAEKVGEVIEVDSDEEEDPEPEVSRAEALALCRRLEGACLQFGHADSPLPLELLKQLRLFRAQLRRDEQLHGKQTTIDAYFR